MPLVAMWFVSLLNRAFSQEHINVINPEFLAPGNSLEEAIKALGIEMDQDSQEFFDSIGPMQREAVRGALYASLVAEPRVPVTFAWVPSYDNELRLFESAGRRESRSATLIFGSPYRERMGSAS